MSDKNNDDDFPPTQAAPPPPPEPPPKPARPRREARAAAAPQTAEAFEAVEQMGPPSWKENPLIWIALVVAMFLAVPLLASMSTRGGTPAKRPPAAAAASAPVEDVSPAAAPIAAPPTATVVPANTAPSPPAAFASDVPPAMRAQATDPTRQMVTKCYEKGRVVYTQTGACTGSMSAVPIDTGKNVVGPGTGAPAPAGGSR